MTSLINLLRDIRDYALNRAILFPVDRKSVEPFLDKLLNYEPCYLIVTLCSNFPNNYAVQFLCCTPEIWHGVKREDFIQIILDSSPETLFPFIEFSHKVLNLDILDLVNKVLKEGIKLATINDYFESFEYCLYLDEDEYEDFESGLLGNMNEFNEISMKLKILGIEVFPQFTVE